ncbi:MAG: septum formation inhibitor Maf [Deltaproteobacteria bacterium]|nr:septum formation inhibitor Maf [Deltaproteobacteria bacterium]
MHIILASTSPRRRELLARLDIVFDVVAPDVNEALLVGESPQQMAERLAQLKANAVAAERPGAIVVGSDTIVVLNEVVLGKPESPADAERMLTTLAGRTHEVITAVAVYDPRTRHTHVIAEVAWVRMTRLDAATIAAYVASGEPMDKAGAYAVQGLGGRLIESIDGDYFAVVGLPLQATAMLLQRVGLVITTDLHALYKDVRTHVKN